VNRTARARSTKRRERPAAATPELLAAALRAQSVGVFLARGRVTAKGLAILFVNESFCAMTGLPEREILGKAHGRFHAESGDLEQIRAWLKEPGPAEPLAGEGYLLRADGGTIYASWSFDRLCDAKGKITHVVASYRDMTEKRKLQEALVHSQRLDAVGQLAGGVAHDFNNLLSVINGYCEILAAHVAANPQAIREVSEIHAAGRKAAALTQQLLAFSRRQPMDSRLVNLTALVNENAEILQRLLGNTCQLDLQLDAALASVRTDPTQFQQVLLNLVLNARDALRDRGRIVITTRHRVVAPGTEPPQPNRAPPGKYVSLSVSDNGTGIDAETQKHLFEPFFTTKGEGKGTGLGLALAYGVVQQSAGFITMTSELLVGTTFEILLPAVDAPADPPSTRGTMSPFPKRRGSEPVLLVERDHVVRKMVAGILTSDGYRVTAVPTVAEALIATAHAKQLVQLLIASVSGEGEKLARALEGARPGLCVINLCSPGELGPVPWLPRDRQLPLSKPFALSELLTSARKLLDRAARNRNATAGGNVTSS
jgi:two-component system, cell cycle sensor histidine kinase and response regulator CckA